MWVVLLHGRICSLEKGSVPIGLLVRKAGEDRSPCAWWKTNLAASLACDEWQRWNRTSFKPEVKAYLAAMVVA
jgi:hypothetical protein